MFCADYIASFVYHGILNTAYKQDQLPHPIFTGALAGFLGASSVYPFDFVRQSQNLKYIHSLSTVPYSLTFFGLYFTCRDKHSLTNQCQWALTSSFCACVAEVPFDKAKLAMMGNRRTMLMANGLYIPFSAMMLVMYDKALERINRKS